MEAAGIAVGVVGLAGLFSACIDCFELVQRGRYLGKEYLLLETKFENQRLRLITWGRACGLSGHQTVGTYGAIIPSGQDPILGDEEVRECIQRTLTHIFKLLNDGKNLMQRYGLKEDQAEIQTRSITSSTFQALTPLRSIAGTSLARRLQSLADRARSTQSQATLRHTARWAIDDKQKFMELIQHLKDLVDDLESATRSLHIVQTYREMIHREIRSISDIQTLETIEQARIGTYDEVSDAASHRLSVLKDLPKNQSIDSIPNPSEAQEVSPKVLNDEWEDVDQQVPRNLQPPKTGNETLYQVLHRVKCPLQQTTVFFDAPSYSVSDGNDDQWVSLDKQRQMTSSSLHLAGARAVANVESYLQHNPQIHFVVFQEYQCCHDADQGGEMDIAPSQNSIYLSSEELCEPMRDCSRIQSSGIAPEFRVGSELHSPWIWYYHLRGGILDAEIAEMEEPKRLYAETLMTKIEEISAADFSDIKTLLVQRKISWKYLPALFPLDEHVLANQELHPDNYQVYGVTAYPHLTRNPRSLLCLEIMAHSWYFDGASREFKTKYEAFRIDEDLFGEQGTATIAIHELPVYPLKYSNMSLTHFDVRASRYWEYALGQSLKRISSLEPDPFWKLGNPRLLLYSGYTFNKQEWLDTRTIIIDIPRYSALGEGRHTVFDLYRHEDMFDERDFYENYDYDYEDGDDPEAEEQIMLDQWAKKIRSLKDLMDLEGNPSILLPSTIMAFDLKDLQWKEVLCDNLRPLGWRCYSLQNLKMPKNRISRLEDVLPNKPNKPFRWGTGMHDKRAIILFYGKPSLDKIDAIQSISYHLLRPIYRLKIADRAVSATTLEKDFSAAIALTRAWEHIVVIEDADALVREGTTEDPERDAKISVFLRLLEDLKGVLILTTRSTRLLDPAVKAIIDLTLQIPGPSTLAERAAIWKKELQSYAQFQNDIYHLERLNAYDLQEHEVRHCVAEVKSLVKGSGEEMLRIFRKFIENTEFPDRGVEK